MDVVDHLEGVREAVRSVSVVLWRSDQQPHVGTSSEKDEGMKTRGGWRVNESELKFFVNYWNRGCCGGGCA